MDTLVSIYLGAFVALVKINKMKNIKITSLIFITILGMFLNINFTFAHPEAPFDSVKFKLPVIRKTEIKNKEGEVSINWFAKDSNYGNNNFFIAKSADGVNFNHISIIRSIYNSNSETPYKYIDASNGASTVYYKLYYVVDLNEKLIFYTSPVFQLNVNANTSISEYSVRFEYSHELKFGKGNDFEFVSE